MINYFCIKTNRIQKFYVFYLHNGFIAIIFSAQFNGKFTAVKSAVHTPLRGLIQALNGIRNIQNQDIMKDTGHASNNKMRNHNIPHNILGQSPPLLLPSLESMLQNFYTNLKKEKKETFFKCERTRYPLWIQVERINMFRN